MSRLLSWGRTALHAALLVLALALLAVPAWRIPMLARLLFGLFLGAFAVSIWRDWKTGRLTMTLPQIWADIRDTSTKVAAGDRRAAVRLHPPLERVSFLVGVVAMIVVG